MGGQRLAPQPAEMEWDGIVAAVGELIREQVTFRREHPTEEWAKVQRDQEAARMRAELEEAVSDSSDEEDMGMEMLMEPVQHEEGLREFERTPVQSAPHNCRLCVGGYADEGGFKMHLNEKHGGEIACGES